MLFEQEDKILCHKALSLALECGAQKARVSLSKSNMDLIATLDGSIDKVTACMDCSLEISLFVDGRFGSFSTNRLSIDALKSFIMSSVQTVRMLESDPARDLPCSSRQVKAEQNCTDLDVFDTAYTTMDEEKRRSLALRACALPTKGKGWKVVSAECEWSDAQECSYVVDSGGLEAFHAETCFSVGAEVTIADSRGRKYSGYWWDANPFLASLPVDSVSSKAVEVAVAQIGAKNISGGKYRMVVDSEVSSKFFSPILRALNGYTIQQGNSFLKDSVGKKMFPEGMTVMDLPHIKRQNGSRYFDSEGVATKEHAIINQGVVQEYFLNTFTANKLGLEPTQEDAIRPALLPYICSGDLCGKTFGREELLRLCGSGILVTDFNGGNSDVATGDFSYGIEGFYFKDGKLVHPVSGMLVTGNFLTLWAGLLAAGTDARPCREKLVPSLAFEEVDFSG